MPSEERDDRPVERAPDEERPVRPSEAELREVREALRSLERVVVPPTRPLLDVRVRVVVAAFPPSRVEERPTRPEEVERVDVAVRLVASVVVRPVRPLVAVRAPVVVRLRSALLARPPVADRPVRPTAPDVRAMVRVPRSGR